MASFNKYSYLTSYGNLPVKSGNEDVILSDGTPNVMTGEYVFYNPKTNKSLASGDIATAGAISIAVGHGRPGHKATELRHVGSETLDLCQAEIKVNTQSPVCAVPQVVDVFLDNTKCGEQYSLVGFLDDTLVRSRYYTNDKARYPFSVSVPCAGCEDCPDDQDNCADVVEAFVDEINGKTQSDPTLITHLQQLNKLQSTYQPFRAVKLHTGANATKRFHLELEDGSCEDCSYIQGIVGIDIDGSDTDFDYTTIQGDATKSLPSQVDYILKLLNDALGDDGSAVLIEGNQAKCCGINIEINTSATVVRLKTGASSYLDPYETANPFAEADGITCGFRIVMDLVDTDCACDFPPNLPIPNYFGRTLTIDPVSSSLDCNFKACESQAQVLPKGLGYEIQERAQYQHAGGKGRNYRYSNVHVGRIPLPDEFSRSSAATSVNCEESYCVYAMLTNNNKRVGFNNARNVHNTNVDFFVVPERHSTTKTSLETYLTALQNRGICAAGNISCGESVLTIAITGTLTVDTGSTTQLTATVTPAGSPQTGTWESSDEAIATVDSAGLVTGVSDGTATITFTSSEGPDKSVVVTVSTP